VLAAGRLAAQQAAVVNALAGVLQAADERRPDAPGLLAAWRFNDSTVRAQAALAMGRIGDTSATPRLLEMLTDPDTTVQSAAAFALGLIRDTTAIPQLRDLVLNTPPAQQNAVHQEAVTALAKIGGRAAADVIREILSRSVGNATSDSLPKTVVRAVNEAWRLGADAPVNMLVNYSVSPIPAVKQGTVYSLARLHATGAANVLLAASDDPDALVRSYAVRALTANYADSAGLDRSALASRVRRLVADSDAHVRINALRTLATYHDSTLVGAALDRLSDPDLNVRVQAVTALGDLGGSQAILALRDRLGDNTFAIKRQAMIGLTRLVGTDAFDVLKVWLTDPDWTLRAAGAEALGYIQNDSVIPWIVTMTRDPDGRVVAVALQSLIAVSPDLATLRAAQLVNHEDPVVRSVAAQRLAAAPDTSYITGLVADYQRGQNDPIPDARIAAVTALGAIAALGPEAKGAVESRFLSRVPRPSDYLVRRAAVQRFPDAAARWGPVTPIETGRTLEDYRDIARRLLLPAAQGGTLPQIVIETDRGDITISLYAADAPVTINAFLQLVDRRYFDNDVWHRVVPNFVIQDGDPRGDGWGGPGFTLRDEINMRRYGTGTVGMALSGPDTGGSQFFITHSPQPHLDGTYTVIGQVTTGMSVVDQVTQGDRIRRIRRQ